MKAFAMTAIKIIQLCASLAAIAAIVGAESMGVQLSAATMALLGAVAGWGVKRPSDMLPSSKGE